MKAPTSFPKNPKSSSGVYAKNTMEVAHVLASGKKMQSAPRGSRAARMGSSVRVGRSDQAPESPCQPHSSSGPFRATPRSPRPTPCRLTGYPR
eukprot:1958776-Alexandrium_andersonii.AAC.1